METKANYAIVGFFTVAVVAAAFLFVFWMSQYGRSGPMADLIVRIPGSANGLSVGSPVRFNGIQIGSVTSLAIDATDPNYSVAFTQVNQDAPIYESTKAILEIQGLTGAAYIELSGGKPGGVNLLEEAAKTGRPPMILADQSSVTNLLATADKILKRADDAIGDIQSFTSDARGPLTNTVKNAETFSKALADNADGVSKFLASVGKLSDTINGLSGRLDSTLASVDALIKAVDPQKIDSILKNADTITANLATSSGELKTSLDKFNKAADNVATLAASANETINKADKLIAAIDPAKVSGSVDDISKAVADARSAVADVKAVTADISNRRQQIDQAITDASELAAKLNKASGRVDGILAKVDGLLGSGDGQSLMAEAKDTLAAYKQVAETLNSKIGPIADNLARFSSSGLGGIQALVGDMRGAVDNLNRAITNFDSDPQRLIFGGDKVKTYDGRTRR
jgi:phospholipid/cholesterol/gamma-HCH transport system substrate-binding protein